MGFLEQKHGISLYFCHWKTKQTQMYLLTGGSEHKKAHTWISLSSAYVFSPYDLNMISYYIAIIYLTNK